MHHARNALASLSAKTTWPRTGCRLDQQQALHAGVSLAPDDDVVVHGDAQPLARLDDLLRHLDVGARRRRIAGGMIVQLPLDVSYLVEIYRKNPYTREREGRLLGAVLDAPPSLTTLTHRRSC